MGWLLVLWLEKFITFLKWKKSSVNSNIKENFSPAVKKEKETVTRTRVIFFSKFVSSSEMSLQFFQYNTHTPQAKLISDLRVWQLTWGRDWSKGHSIADFPALLNGRQWRGGGTCNEIRSHHRLGLLNVTKESRRTEVGTQVAVVAYQPPCVVPALGFRLRSNASRSWCTYVFQKTARCLEIPPACDRILFCYKC